MRLCRGQTERLVGSPMKSLGFDVCRNADGDCSLEIKRCLLLGRKVMTNLDSILKSRDITSSAKIHLVKAIVALYGRESWTFPVSMYGCDS